MILPELLLPAGNLSKLRMALAYGADAVYVGAAGFSMRPDEAAFTVDQLGEAVAVAHQAGRRLYVALNTLMFDADLDPLRHWLEIGNLLAMRNPGSGADEHHKPCGRADREDKQMEDRHGITELYAPCFLAQDSDRGQDRPQHKNREKNR